MRRLRILAILCALLTAAGVSAAPIILTPSLELQPEREAARLRATDTSNTTLEGQGSRLKITYTSPVEIDMEIGPILWGGIVDPASLLHVVLPPGQNQEAIFDLTASPSWSLFPRTYYLGSYASARGQIIHIANAEFLPATGGEVIRAIGQHLRVRERYLISTIHALRGMQMLGISIATIVGIATLVVFFFALRRRTALPLLILSVGILVYAAWFSIDLARFTVGHARDWYGNGTYGITGSVHAIGEYLRDERDRSGEPMFVFVCSDGTDYSMKMLRYLVYPTRVSLRPEDAVSTTHVVVINKHEWSYRDGILHCGQVEGNARQLQIFPDSSVVFQVRAP